MSEEKTFVFPESKSGSMDAASLLAMMNNGGGFGGNGNWLWVIFLFFLYGWGGNGMFGRNGNGSGLASEINGDYGRSLLLQAINGNGTAISQLASTLNCDVNAIQTAITSVQSSIASVGSQVGLSGQQVINAIQSGNQTLASQLSQCCCDNKLLVTTQGYENRIANAEQTSILGSKIDGNSAAITSAIAAQTTLLNDKFCALEMREMQSKIDNLTAEKNSLQSSISNANQTAQIQAYIASVITPLQNDVNAIKAAQPATVTTQYSPFVAVPNCIAAQYGLAGYGVNNGIWS